ncbi:hypothetical protein GC197_14000 [bacterium]|nr:hypothetical protein [bacterium]
MNGFIPAFGRSIRLAIAVGLFAVLAAGLTSSPVQADVPNTWYGDATLNDLTFVDDRHGIAVGDHGTIWHTKDSGKTWEQAPSGTDAHLESIHFADLQHGWAVGGYQQPYSDQSTGVVLRTADGGVSWEKMPDQMLPKLADVSFEDARHGWAVGQGSNVFPSGLFETTDGGRSWRSLPGVQNIRFQKFAALTNGELLLAGVGGTLSLADRGGIRKPTIQVDPLRDMQDIVVAGRQNATAVGEGGLILQSQDAGSSWEINAADPLRQTDRQVDFYAVERLGDEIWIGGNPGSFLLHSKDGGESWSVERLPTTATIRAIFFQNESSGWAIGALGTILHTTDGGQTWVVQRKGGERLALLGIFHDPNIIPYELISHHAGAQGYLTGMEIINRPRQQTDLPRPPLHDAVVHSGGDIGHTAWQFPADDARLMLSGKQMIAGWDEANDGQGLAAMEKYLVQRIRQWRPSVVLTDYADPTGKQPLSYLVNQVVLRAIEKANDSQAYPEHLSELGLQTWRVSRVCSVVPEGQNGPITLNSTQISPQLAMSLSEHASISRGIATGALTDGPATIEMKVLQTTGLLENRLSNLFSGLSIPAGEEARRDPQQMMLVDLAKLQRTAQKRRNLLGMINHAVENDQQNALMLGQMLELSKELPPERSVEVLSHLASKANQSGNLTLAADMHHQVIEKFSGHVLAEKSAAWLLAYYASKEIRYLNRSNVEFAAPTAPSEEAPPTGESEEEVATVSFNDPRNYTKPTKATNRAGELITKLNQTMPQALADPSLAFVLERLLADQGNSRQGESYLRRLLNLGQDDPWCRRAQWELVLGRSNARVDAPIVAANYDEAKPVLDGLLDDHIWQTGKPQDLLAGTTSVPKGAAPAAIMVGFDQDFLYLAVRCMKSKGFLYQAPNDEPRTRDADLEQSDRVCIYLDLDRDYATAYQLAVDYRGLSADSLAGNVAWNPKWFVAARQDAKSWTVEAAIPLSELSADPVHPGDAWGMAAERIVIGEGTQTWPSCPRFELSPKDFGLLQFQ